MRWNGRGAMLAVLASCSAEGEDIGRGEAGKVSVSW